MKKLILGLAIVSAFGASAVQAEPTVGATGVIIFEGSISNETCVVHSDGPGSAGGKVLRYAMNDVPKGSLGTEAVPGTSLNGKLTPVPVDMNLTVECESGTSIDLLLNPTIPSGKGIGVTGTAEGVQIMLVQNDQIIDFSGGPVTISANLSGNQASIPLKAYYTIQANADYDDDVKVGTAEGSVAYVLSYN